MCSSDLNDGGRRSGNSPKFTGAIPDFGHVFALGSAPSQYPTTCQHLSTYVSREYRKTPQLAALFDDPPVAPLDALACPPAAPDQSQLVRSESGTVSYVASKLDEKVWDKECDLYVAQRDKIKSATISLFGEIFGQCNPPLVAFIKAHAQFKEKKAAGDCVWLLNEVRKTTSKFDPSVFVQDALVQHLTKLYSCNQGKRSTDEYYNVFKDQVAVL